MAGIYIHVPFCRAKCAYCDFYSIARIDMADSYVEAVCNEFEHRRAELGDEKVSTIYLGGGTPSSLTAKQLATICSALPKAGIIEHTIEVNPEDVNEKAIAGWIDAGVNRVSMGVQSLVDNELRIARRRHDAAAAISAIRQLRAAGISNVSCDLIYGLPQQTPDSWKYSVDTLLAEGIAHLSAYCLSIEPHTTFGLLLRKGQISEASEETIVSMYEYLCRASAECGMEHYEISNFAMPGKRSKHNSAYWDGTPYLGLGPGAHSLDINGIRRYVPSDLKAYISNPSQAALTDPETDTERVNDIIFTRLRTSDGLDITAVPERFRAQVQANLEHAAGKGLLSRRAEAYRIPSELMLTSDAIIRDILLDSDRL